MPFNGSGIYSPPGLPVFPPSAGQVISSSYYTQVINDISSALSLTFLRDGSIPMVADLNMQGSGVKNLGDGTVSSPSLRFNSNANTGIYYSLGLAFSVAGVQAMNMSSTAVTVPGILNVTGVTNHTGTVNGVGAVFSSSITAAILGLDASYNLYKDGSSNPILQFDSGDLFSYDRTANQLAFTIAAAQKFSLNSTGGSFTGALAVGGIMTTAGAVSNGAVKVNTSGSTASLVLSDAGGNGANLCLTSTGSTPNKTLRSNTAGNFEIINSAYNTSIFSVTDTGNISAPGTGTFGGNIRAGGGILPNSADVNCVFSFNGGNPELVFDSGDLFQYARSANKLTFFVDGVAVFSIDSTGNVIAKGNVTAGGTP